MAGVGDPISLRMIDRADITNFVALRGKPVEVGNVGNQRKRRRGSGPVSQGLLGDSKPSTPLPTRD